VRRPAKRRHGRAIIHGSGDAALDPAAMEMLQRAQPFPPPPTEMRGETFKLTLPVTFMARSRPGKPPTAR
jgi:protein TonB